MASVRAILLPCAASLIFVLSLWGPQYALRGHWGPDEARFVYVAREMAAAHSPVIPLRNGEIYAHKPPLMMWLIQFGEACFGSPFGSRLPSLLGAVLSFLAIYALGRRLADRRTALLAVLLSASSIEIWTVFGRGQIDALLTGFVLSSAALFLSCRGRVATIRILPAFLCAGLGILAKGPVGLILPALIVAAVRLPDRDWRLPELKPGQWVAGFAATLLVPVLWLAAAALAGAPAAYFREIVFSQNVSRAGGGYGHNQPFWYLFAEFPVGFLPWTLLLPFAIAILWKDKRILLRQCAIWVLSVIVFFSLPSSKRAVYILSAYPAAAFLVASAAGELQSRRWFRRTVCAIVVALPLLLIAAGFFLLLKGSGSGLLPGHLRDAAIVRGLATACFVSALLAGVGIKLLAVGFAERNALLLAAILLNVLLACVGGLALPAIGPSKEPRELIPLVERIVPPHGRILLYRMDGELLCLHAGRRGRRLDDDDAMRKAMEAEGAGLALFYEDAGNEAETRFAPHIRETGTFMIGKRRYGWARFAALETTYGGHP